MDACPWDMHSALTHTLSHKAALLYYCVFMLVEMLRKRAVHAFGGD